MQFEINKENIELLKEWVDAKNTKEVARIVEHMHPADIAEVMEDLTIVEAKFIYLLLDDEKASDVLVEIPDQDRKRFLKVLPQVFT